MTVVVTADRARSSAGRRAARPRAPTAVLAIDGAIVAVGDPDDVARRSARRRRAPRSLVAAARWSPARSTRTTTASSRCCAASATTCRSSTWRDQALYRYSPRLGADDMATAALFAFGEMLLHGVTTVCDFYYLNAQGNDHATATIEAARRLGIRIVLARCFYDWDGAPAAYRETIPQAVANFEALAERYQDRERFLDDGPAGAAQPARRHAGDDRGRRRLRARRRRAVAHPPRRGAATRSTQSLERFGARPLHAIAALPVDMSQMIAVHGCWFDAGERALLAERGGSPRLLPGLEHVPRRRRHRSRRSRRARRAASGLGTDGGCSNNRVSVFDEMRMAALLQKVHRTDGQAIDAETCFALGTAHRRRGPAAAGRPDRARLPLRPGRARSRRSVAVAGPGPGKERRLRAVTSRHHRRRGRWSRGRRGAAAVPCPPRRDPSPSRRAHPRLATRLTRPDAGRPAGARRRRAGAAARDASQIELEVSRQRSAAGRCSARSSARS